MYVYMFEYYELEINNLPYSYYYRLGKINAYNEIRAQRGYGFSRIYRKF